MKTFIVVFFCLISHYVSSQALNEDAKEIKAALDRLKMQPTNIMLQKAYVVAFPSTTKKFLRVFQTATFDQLYVDAHEYIDTLRSCSTTYPREVISKIVDLGKNLMWDADAVGYLQKLSVSLAITHSSIFITKLKELKASDQNKLIAFYADVENHRAYPEYEQLILELKSSGQTSFAKKLEQAKSRRIRVPNYRKNARTAGNKRFCAIGGGQL